MIETKRLNLRPFKEEDKNSFVNMMIDKKVTHFLPKEYDPQSAEDIWYKEDEKDILTLAITLKNHDKFLGYVSLRWSPEDSSVSEYPEIGWFLSPSSSGKGYATEAAQALLDYVAQKSKHKEVIAFTSHKNLPSINVMKKLGMTFIGEVEHPSLKDKNHPLYPCIFYKKSL